MNDERNIDIQKVVRQLFAMAVTPYKEYLFLLYVNRKLVNLSDPKIDRLNFDVDETAFIYRERHLHHFVLSSLLVCSSWDGLKSFFVRSIALMLVCKPDLCEESVPLRRIKDALGRISSMRNPISNLEQRAQFANLEVLESAIDRLDFGVREGIEGFEYWLSELGVSNLTAFESAKIEPFRSDFIKMHRMRNSIVHLMGKVKPIHRSDYHAESSDRPSLIFWQPDDVIAEKYIKNTCLYLGIICNRIARTLGVSEPAPMRLD